MPAAKAEREWANVKLPVEIAERIDARLEEDGTFRSRGEFVKNAVIRALETTQASAEA